MSLNKGQKDIAGLLAEWREVTDKATEGPWFAGDPDFGVLNGSSVVSVGGVDIIRPRGLSDGTVTPSRPDAVLAATSRTAMPRLLAAVQAVLQLDDAEVRHDDSIVEGYNVGIHAAKNEILYALEGAK